MKSIVIFEWTTWIKRKKKISVHEFPNCYKYPNKTDISKYIRMLKLQKKAPELK